MKKWYDTGNTGFVKYGTRVLNYREIDEQSDHLSRVLFASGIGEGDVILSMVKSPLDNVILFFAVLKSGAILFPVNPEIEQSLYDHVINNAKPKLIVSDFKRDGISFESLRNMNVSDQKLNSHQEYNTKRTVLTLLTGGSTGTPKGAEISEDAIMWNAFNTVLTWGISSGDRTLVCMPLYHTGGWNILLIPTLVAGGNVIFSENNFDPTEIIKLIDQERITIFMGVPTMYEKLVGCSEFYKKDLSEVRMISGGGKLRNETFEKLLEKNIKVFQGYGLTEAGPNNFYISPENQKKFPDSVGTPCIFVDVKLAEDGELLIRGNHLFSRYMFGSDSDPVEKDGFFRTGDIFRKNEYGYYFFVQRKKNVIKTGGENVYATEVEDALLSLPYVVDCSVIGRPDNYWGEIVVAFVRTNENKTENTIRNDLRIKLSGYKIPKKIIFVESIPRTGVGKVSREELVKLYEKSIH